VGVLSRERCCSNTKTPPCHPNLRFATLRTRRLTLLRASARTPSEASSRQWCGHASRHFTRVNPKTCGNRRSNPASRCFAEGQCRTRPVMPRFPLHASRKSGTRGIVPPFSSTLVKSGSAQNSCFRPTFLGLGAVPTGAELFDIPLGLNP